MGSRDAEVYLGSPRVVAASALAGYIAEPESTREGGASGGTIEEAAAPERGETRQARVVTIDGDGRRGGSGADGRLEEKTDSSVEIIDGFPRLIVARALFMNRDNLNTDGIYAGKWTYQDDLIPEQMARVVFENYDDQFDAVYRDGDLIVSGRNFGSGSSREQAATALRYRGIPCVVAASFSQTYKRNAFNNGFPVLECADLVDHLKTLLKGAAAPTVAGPDVEVDFLASAIRCGDLVFAFAPLGRVPQELIVAGGAEELVRRRISAR